MTFNGGLSFDLIDSIVHVMSCRLDKVEKDINLRKKVFGAVMECLQNLGNHVEDYDLEEVEYDPCSVLFVLDAEDNGYKIITTNFIPNEKVNNLRDRIETIKQLSPPELKKKYNEVLLKESYTEKGGGGLGLLDIALRSDGKIDYEFQPVNETFSLFSFKTLIIK